MVCKINRAQSKKKKNSLVNFIKNHEKNEIEISKIENKMRL